MNRDDLTRTLRTLADVLPREAPPHVESALKEAFRRNRGARRWRRGLAVAISTGAAAALFAVVTRVPAPSGPRERFAVRSAPPAVASVKPSAAVPKAKRITPIHKRDQRLADDQFASSEFVPLPYGDDALIGESSTIVRVELPRSALRLAGFSVAQERANDRVQADIVLGADGLAHAVRFVRYTE